MAKKKKFAVVFVHGLAKKPSPKKLEEIWLWALGRNGPRPEVFGTANPGIDLNDQGVVFDFTYWADVFYGTDYETDVSDQYEKANEVELSAVNVDVVAGELKLPEPGTTRELRFLAELERKLSETNTPGALSATELAYLGTSQAVDPGQFEIASWLPRPVKQAIIRKAAMEAYYYLFNKQYERSDGARFHVRDELRGRLLRDLTAARESAEKVVVVSHSMGTVIAYDVLRNVEACPSVDTLFTVGSPLGITEVQDELRAADSKQVDFPAFKLQHWFNVYDPLDPICGLDPKFANDFAPVDGKRVVDIDESNWGNWRHTITHYLAGVKFRSSLADALGINRS
jgi:hypothetical protein